MWNFYVTVGRGLSQVVGRMLGLSDLPEFQLDRSMEGKLLFHCAKTFALIPRLTSLKGVERIFLQVDCWMFDQPPTVEEIQLRLDRLTGDVPNYLADWRMFQNPTATEEPEGEEGIPKAKVPKLNAAGVSFRVNVKLAGTAGRQLDYRQVASRFARLLISGNSDWTVDLTSPLVEISVHVNDLCCIVGLPLTKSPLSKRTYAKQPGLRSTICDVMVSLADIRSDGLVIVDPMCGAGTILVELIAQRPVNTYLGMDCSWEAVVSSDDNLRFASECLASPTRWNLLVGDGTRIPLRASTVDRILTDIPFGRKHKTVDIVEVLLVKLLVEVSRVLKPDGLAVLLCPAKVEKSIQRLIDSADLGSDRLRIAQLFPLSLGVTKAVVVSLTFRSKCQPA